MRKNGIHGNAGSALTLILVGIVLLAAIIYTITRTSGGGNSAEQTTFATDAIMRYGDDMHGAVQRILSNGNDVSRLSFESAETTAIYHNANATAVTSVFNAAGGGMKYMTPDPAWLDSAYSAQPAYGAWVFPNSACVPFVGRGGDSPACNADGVDNEEVFMELVYVRTDICTQIDRNAGIALCAGAPCTLSLSAGMPVGLFTGTFADGLGVLTAGGQYNGHFEGCFQGSGAWAGINTYYKVLAER